MPTTNNRLFKVEIVRVKDESEKNTPEKSNSSCKKNNICKEVRDFKEKYFGCVLLRDESANGGGPAKSYICVDPDEVFQVKISTPQRGDPNTYGAVLFIDG